MKLFPEQIKKILASAIRIEGYTMTSTTDSVDVTTELAESLLTAGDGGIEVPLFSSSSVSVQGVIIDSPSNMVEIWDNTTKLKLENNGREVYGRLEEGEGYILSFYYLDSGVETSYTVDEDTIIDIEFNYRFNFENLPTDAIIALKTRNLYDDANSGANVYDKDKIYSTRYEDYVSFKTVQDALDYIIFPGLVPKFTLFELDGIDTFIEVGSELETDVTFNWTSQESGSIVPGSVKIYDHETSTLLYSGLDATGTQAHSFVTEPVKTVIGETYKFRIEAETVQGYTIVRYITFTWVGRIYYGSDATLSESILSSERKREYSFADEDGYKFICTPQELGLQDSNDIIHKQSNMVIPINNATLTITNVNGVSIPYYVYRSYYELNADLIIILK